MIEGIYRSEFEAMKASHIMRRRMSYMSTMKKQVHNKRSVARVFAGKTNFWQNVLERLVNVTLMLEKCNLPFRKSSEQLSKDNKGNFFLSYSFLPNTTQF